jgi:hypothetical protein
MTSSESHHHVIFSRTIVCGLDSLRRWWALRTIVVVLFGFAATAFGLRAQTVSTFASGFIYPNGLAFDTAGNLYVVNNLDFTVSMVTPGGAVSTFASGIYHPAGLAFDTDTSGNLYVASRSSSTVSKITPGGVTSTFASGFSNPYGLAFDTSGNLFVANYTANTVSEVTPGGVVSTFASGFSGPYGLAFDTAGNLYVTNFNVGTVSKVTPGGVVSTFASGFSGPAGLAFDTAGNLYVANSGANTVNKVTPGGVVSTFASGISGPYGLAFDTAGNLYVANYYAGTVSKVIFTPIVTTPTSASVASTTATLGGNVTSDAGVTITEIGVVYSVTATNGTPQIGGTGVTKVVGTGTIGVFTVSATGLTAGTGYSYAAYATNSRGTSYSSTGTFTPNTAPTFVGSTTTLTVDANSGANDIKSLLHVSDSDSSQTETWSQNTGPSHGTLSFNGGTATASSGGTDLITASTITYTPATDYAGGDSFTVQVSDGIASITRTITVTVNPNVPGKPTGVSATPGDRQALVSFTAPASGGSPIIVYTVSFSPGGGTVTGAASPITVTGLTNGTAYTFTVVALNAVDFGDTSDPSAAVTPKAPQTITFANPGTQNFGTSPTLTATSSSTLPVTFTSSTTSVATITSGGVLTFVATGTATINADQAGDSSHLAAPTVSQSFTVAAVVPGAPTIGTATAGVTQASVSFSAPAFTGGASITGYTVTSNPGGLTGTGTASPITVTGLTNGTAYTFTVTATNSAGTGAASSASNSVTPNPGPTVVSVAVPTNGSYKSGTNLDFVVTFDKSATITGTPRIALVIGTTTVQANYVSSPTAATALFRYTVLDGQNDTDGIAVGALTLNGGTIRGASGVDATLTLNSVGSTTNVLVDTTALTITSAATASGTYGAALTPYNITASKTVASYSATGLPGGVTVNTGTGAISGTPTAAGSFSVTLGATDLAGNAGSKTLTLTVAQASQTVSFAAIGSVTVGSPVALSASASSGLPVTFSVVSGSAAVSGSTLTVNDSGSVVVRATQAGNSNYNAASADQTVSGAAKLAQTITFAALPDRRVGDVPFALTATASSGLPVSFAIASGPALLNGATLTLGGTSGTVTVSASQPGNATYNAAPDVVRTFTVVPAGPLIFFGTLGSATIAAEIAPNGQSGTLIGTIPGTGDGFVVNFTLDATGSFAAPATVFANPQSTAAAVAAADAPGTAHALVVTATASTRTFRGVWSGGVLSGSLVELGLTFSTTQQPLTGSTAAIAGYYTAASTNTATGATYSVVGTQGQVYVLAVTPTLVTAGSCTITGSSTCFTVQTPAAATIAATIDTPTTTVTGTITLPNQTTQTFAGLNATTVRTDRLVSLSSRAMVNDPAGDAGTLIAGFVITGAVPKPVLLRAIGPSLAAYGVRNPLADPRLTLYDATGHVLLENDNWGGTSTLVATQSRLGAFALDPASKDAVLLTTLAPGLYTMRVSDSGGQGVALAEVYDASDNPQAEYQRLIDISTRGPVTAGEGALIGGFSVTGNSPKKVLVRGIGPGLTAYGLPSALADPLLTVYNAAGVPLAQNDQWETSAPLTAAQTSASPADLSAAFTSTGAFALAHGSKDAALIVVLAPGAYTAVVSGVGGQTGVALVEIYEIPTGN